MPAVTFSKEELLKDLHANTVDLLAILSRFSKEDFNKIPFAESWTAGQVAQHLYKAESGVPMLFKMELSETERAIDEKMPIIRSVFLNFDTKLKSPDFILPDAEEKDPEEFVKNFTANRQAVDEIIATADLTKTVTGLSLPQMGTLTGWEWICFMTSHAIRHTRQLQNIYAALHPAS